MEDLIIKEDSLPNLFTDKKVIKALDKFQNEALQESCKTRIYQMEDKVLLKNITPIINYIVCDLNVSLPKDRAGNLMISEVMRITRIFKRYYSNFSLSEIRLAFEYTQTGMLDDFLPLDRQGNVDKSHYGAFNTAYISKVLNAYNKYRNKAAKKAVEHESVRLLPPKSNDQAKKDILKLVRLDFEEYKDSGNLTENTIHIMYAYESLVKSGHIVPSEPEDEDRKKAYFEFIKKDFKGLVNKYDAFKIKNKGRSHEDLNVSAQQIQMRREVKEVFDQLINKEK